MGEGYIKRRRSGVSREQTWGRVRPGKSFDPVLYTMEFPDLGQHCSEATCKQLDFLSLKCDACNDVFCKNHITSDQHRCAAAYKKDVQVPVCPLCSSPVPVKRGEMPDVAVGAHMDRNCNDPYKRKQKIFTNKCLKAGCKKKELLKIECDQCHNNFCLSHRHPLDHNCKTGPRTISKTGLAALCRAQEASKQDASTGDGVSGPANAERCRDWKPQQKSNNQPVPEGARVSCAVALQNGLPEDEALQRALELSLLDAGIQPTFSPQEEAQELACALTASREEYKRFQLKTIKATGK
ncbi:AN1-type zinc finger protein 2A isoform X2 [Ascaphus truei]|uniref:AN1-type zinc finger protein 2A isoform X2 n=1 Tax=Ascaphus truei TaxID=8439 RepID=UPI003F596C8E